MARARCSSAPTRRPSDVASSKGPVQTAGDSPLAVKGRALRQSENGDRNPPRSRRTTTPDTIQSKRGRLSSPHPSSSRPASAAISRKASPQPRQDQPPIRVPRAATAASGAQPSPAAANRAASPGPPRRPASASAAGPPRFTAAPLPYHQRLRGLLDGYRPASAGQAGTPLPPPPRPPSSERQSRPVSQPTAQQQRAQLQPPAKPQHRQQYQYLHQQHHMQQQQQCRPASAAGGLTVTDISVCVEGKSMELCQPAAKHERPGSGGGCGLDPRQQQPRQQEGGEGGLVPTGPEAEEYWEWLMKEESPPESPYGSDVLRALISVISPKFAVKRPADYIPITPSSLSSSRYVRSDIWPGSSPNSPALPLTADPLAAPTSPAGGPGATTGDVTTTSRTSPTTGAAAATGGTAAPPPPVKPLHLPTRVSSARQPGPSPRGLAPEEVLQRRLLRRAASAAMAAVISMGGTPPPARLLYGSRHVPFMVLADGEPTLQPVVSASGMVGMSQQQQYEPQHQAKRYREGIVSDTAPKSDPGAVRRSGGAAAAAGGARLVAEEATRASGGAASARSSTSARASTGVGIHAGASVGAAGGDGARKDMVGSGGGMVGALRPRSESSTGAMAAEGAHAATAAAATVLTSPRSPGQRRRRRRSSAVSGGRSTGSPPGPLSPPRDDSVDGSPGPPVAAPGVPVSVMTSPFTLLASVTLSPRGAAGNDAIDGALSSVSRSSVRTAVAAPVAGAAASVRQSRDGASWRPAAPAAPGSPPARVREQQQQRTSQQQSAEPRPRWEVVDHEPHGAVSTVAALGPSQGAGVWGCEAALGGVTPVATTGTTTSGDGGGGEDGGLDLRQQGSRASRQQGSAQTQRAHRRSLDVSQDVNQQDVRHSEHHSQAAERRSLEALSLDTELAYRQQQDVRQQGVRQQEGVSQVGLYDYSLSSSTSGSVVEGSGVGTAPGGPTAPAGGGSTAAAGGGKSRFFRQQAGPRPLSACDMPTLAHTPWSQAVNHPLPPPPPEEEQQPPSSSPPISSLTLLQWDEHPTDDTSRRREGAAGGVSGRSGPWDGGGHGSGEQKNMQSLRPPLPPGHDVLQSGSYGHHTPYQQQPQQRQQPQHPYQQPQQQPERPHPYQPPQPQQHQGSSAYPAPRGVRFNGRRRWSGPRSPTKSPQKQTGPLEHQQQQQQQYQQQRPPHTRQAQPSWATPEGNNGSTSSRGGPPSTSSASGSAATASVTYSAATSSSASAATSTASTPASAPVQQAGPGGWGSSAATSTDESPHYPHAAAVAAPRMAVAVRTAQTECGGAPSSTPSSTTPLPLPGASPSTSSGSTFSLPFRPRAQSASASPYDSPIRPAPPILRSSPSSGPRRSPPVILPLTWEPPPMPSPELLRMGTPAKVRHSPLRHVGASGPGSSPSGESGSPPDGMTGSSSCRMTNDGNGSASGVTLSRFAPTAVQYDNSTQYNNNGGFNPPRVELGGQEGEAEGGERRPLAWIGPSNGRQPQPREQPQAPATISGNGPGGAGRRGWMTGAVFTAADAADAESGKAVDGRPRREAFNSGSAGGGVLDGPILGGRMGGMAAAAGSNVSDLGRPSHNDGGLSARGSAAQQSRSNRRRWTIADGVGGIGPTQGPEHASNVKVADGGGVRDAVSGGGGGGGGGGGAHSPRGDGRRGSSRRAGSSQRSTDHTLNAVAGAAASAALAAAPASPSPPASPQQSTASDLREITLSAPSGAAAAVAAALCDKGAAEDGVRRNLLMSFRHVGGPPPPPPPPATASPRSNSSTAISPYPYAIKDIPAQPSSNAGVAAPNGAAPPSRRRRWEPREGSLPEERDQEGDVGAPSQSAARAALGGPAVHSQQGGVAERTAGSRPPLDHRDSNAPRCGLAPAHASVASSSRAGSADTAVGSLPGSAPTQNRAAAINPRQPTTTAAEMVGGRLEARRDSRPPSAEGKCVLADVGESTSAVRRGSGGESGRQYSNQRNRERAMMLNRVMEALGLGHLSVPTP